MSVVITNNVASLTAQNNLARTSDMLSQTLERLSSGLKVNRGADGPAALVISEQQRAQISGLQAAIDNTSKAVSMVQTTEGALNEINALLDQMRSLSVDSANSAVYDSNALAANQAEVANAIATIDRIANNTQFGTKKVLDGSAGLTGVSDNANTTFLKAAAGSATGTFAVNITSAGSRANVTAGSAQTQNLAANETLTINGIAVQLTAGQSQAQVVATINTYTAQTGVTAVISGGATQLYTNAYGSSAKLSVQSTVAGAANSSGFGTSVQTSAGTDVAGTIGGFTATGNGNVLTGTTGGGASGISVQLALAAGSNTTTVTGAQGNVIISDNSLVFQIGANYKQTGSVTVDKVTTAALGIGVSGVQWANLSQLDVRTQAGAQDSIKVIDQAISDVSDLRGRLGAFQQQTLSSTANNLRATLENTTSAESVIRDTDFAKETANLAKYQVLAQAGTSVLASANQSAQLVLALLNGK